MPGVEFYRDTNYKTLNLKDFIACLKNGNESEIKPVQGEITVNDSSNKISNRFFRRVSFSHATIKGIRFSNCQFIQCDFVNTKLLDCEFLTCTFKDCNPYKIEISNTLINPKSFKGMLDPKHDANIGLHLYQQLYKNASNAQQVDHQREALYNFKIWQRYQWNWDRRNHKLTYWQYITKAAPSYFHYYLAQHGLKSPFFIINTIALFTVLVIINYIFSESLGLTKIKVLSDSIYFTAITITTVGYGDITPVTCAGKIAASLESLCGASWMGIFTAVIIRRVLQ